MKSNSLEYRKFLNLTIKYNDANEGFIKLKQNPNIEYFKSENMVFRNEMLTSPSYIYGLVLRIGNNCKYFNKI